jgi:hypothetical protein
LLQYDLACFEITGFARARVAFTNIAHAIFIDCARTFWTNTQGSTASKVDGFRFIIIRVTEIKLQLKAGIRIVFVVFRNFSQLNDGGKWTADLAPKSLQ